MSGFRTALAKEAGGAGASAGRSAGSSFSSSFGSAARGVGKLAFAGLAAGVAATGGALAYAAKQGVDFNSMMEQSRTAFRVLLKDTKKADKAIADLYAYSAKTPFQFEEVAAAGRMFATVGLDIKKTVGWVGDLASVAPASAGGIEEVARAISRLASGDFGESFERLRDFGISRKMLEGEGLKFDKGGQYQGSVDQALAAVEHIVKTRFGGMADEQSKTFGGMLSTLKDNIAQMFGGASKPLFDWLKESMPGLSAWVESDAAPALKSLFAAATGALKDVDWAGLVQNIRDFASGLAGNPGAYEEAAKGISDIVGSINSLGQEIGGAQGLGFWIRETFATIGEFGTLISGIADMLHGAFTLDWGLVTQGAGKVSDALWGTAQAASGTEQAIYDVTGKLIGWNLTPAESKEPNSTFIPVGQGIQDATGKLVGWNGTPAFEKTPLVFPKAESTILAACHALDRWNDTDVYSKSAVFTFRSVESGSSTPIPGSADGNYFPSPSLTAIAEDAPEYAIPARATPRSLALYESLGRDLGVGGNTFHLYFPVSDSDSIPSVRQIVRMAVPAISAALDAPVMTPGG